MSVKGYRFIYVLTVNRRQMRNQLSIYISINSRGLKKKKWSKMALFHGRLYAFQLSSTAL